MVAGSRSQVLVPSTSQRHGRLSQPCARHLQGFRRKYICDHWHSDATGGPSVSLGGPPQGDPEGPSGYPPPPPPPSPPPGYAPGAAWSPPPPAGPPAGPPTYLPPGAGWPGAPPPAWGQKSVNTRISLLIVGVVVAILIAGVLYVRDQASRYYTISPGTAPVVIADGSCPTTGSDAYSLPDGKPCVRLVLPSGKASTVDGSIMMVDVLVGRT